MTATKALCVDESIIRDLTTQYPTPFYLYDEKNIVENSKTLYDAFSWAPDFKNYFAVKATPTPKLISLLISQGMGVDCSSYAELLLAERLNIPGELIMFTSNNTPKEDLQKAYELNAIINLDDISLIDYMYALCGMPELICFRYNPGSLKSGNTIIGDPREAKYGLTKEQLFDAYAQSRSLGAKRFGLHTMVASNELQESYFIETAELLFELAVELKHTLNITLEFINLGGGIGIPYTPTQSPINFHTLSQSIKKKYDAIIVKHNLDPIIIKMENGRVVTGPYGLLVSTVLHKKDTYKKYVGLDACMAHLMRPGMYGAYHHISVLGKTSHPHDMHYDVTGGLCENNDKFAIDRELPSIDIGDIIVIHDSGAHGHAMGFNYNGKLRCAELLLRTNGEIELIRRHETYEDYFKTVIW